MSTSYIKNTRAIVTTFYRNKPWTGRFLLSIFILLLALTIFRAALPQAIIYNTTSWLEQKGIHASIESVDISLFNGSISLTNATGSKKGKPLFNIGLIDIHWHWTPLSDKTLKVTKITLDQLNLNIEQYNDEVVVGGLHILLTPPVKEENKTPNINTSDETTPWAASLGEIVFTNFNVCYLQHASSITNASAETKAIDYCAHLNKMSWTGNIGYAVNKKHLDESALPITSTGNFILNELSIIDNKLGRKLLTSKSNTINGVTVSSLKSIRIDELNMNGLSVMQRDDNKHKDTLRFSQLTINDINLSNLNTLSIENIKLNDPALYLVKQTQSDWEYQQWVPLLNDTKPKTETATKSITNHSSFHVNINNITIDNADLCYLETFDELYYCYTSDHFSWRGNIIYNTKATDNNFSLNGDLNLSHSIIHNFSIGRNLLALSSLELSNINVESINNVSVEKINIKQLGALQRGTKQDDATASFENLLISDLKYSPDNIAVNTVNLSGLTTHVSKNKVGEWEHSKWLIKTKNTANSTNTNDEKAATKPPLILSLNKLNVSTDNKIQFTDNSTEPAMEIGLQQLSFDISKLNPEKPETDSPFKLRVKTTRHSTINLAGTVRPFANKISLDAKGKLKGFDLRAASPASEKAIGHIIKSGQMDADLTLLAKEGKLESNIALSLYHFNIKSMSEKDTKTLDEKFGMPLNQTLALLRDKDDSIHLDIPVTGDVNNPDFNPMDAIIKATSKAATVTLITFYTPYGLVYAGGNVLFNLATAMNFDPVEFKPGVANIKGEEKDKLNKLATLLIEKPQIHLTLCGMTNTADTYSLYPTLNKKKISKDDQEQPLTNAQRLALTLLAKERQENVKNYLIKESSITHDRLILCAPEHQTHDEAIAGVEINI